MRRDSAVCADNGSILSSRALPGRRTNENPVRRTYRLDIEGKHPDRLLEASKHDIRKYIKRERGKALPADADFWDFDSKAGVDEASAQPVPFPELIRAVDALVAAGNTQFYVEVLRKPAKRTPRPAATTDAAPDPESDFED